MLHSARRMSVYSSETGDGTFTGRFRYSRSQSGTQHRAVLRSSPPILMAITNSTWSSPPLIDSSNQATGLAVLARQRGRYVPGAITVYACRLKGARGCRSNGDGILRFYCFPDQRGRWARLFPRQRQWVLSTVRPPFRPMTALPQNRYGRGYCGGLKSRRENRSGECLRSARNRRFCSNISQAPPPFTVVSAGTFIAGPAAPNSIVTALGNNLTTGTDPR